MPLLIKINIFYYKVKPCAPGLQDCYTKNNAQCIFKNNQCVWEAAKPCKFNKCLKECEIRYFCGNPACISKSDPWIMPICTQSTNLTSWQFCQNLYPCVKLQCSRDCDGYCEMKKLPKNFKHCLMIYNPDIIIPDTSETD